MPRIVVYALCGAGSVLIPGHRVAERGGAETARTFGGEYRYVVVYATYTA